MRSGTPAAVAIGMMMLDQVRGHAHPVKLWDEWISGKRVVRADRTVPAPAWRKSDRGMML
jgi:hypothetical protein